ncbi:hypothetical protein P3K79_28485, partial [Bacillus anthracis]
AQKLSSSWIFFLGYPFIHYRGLPGPKTFILLDIFSWLPLHSFKIDEMLISMLKKQRLKQNEIKLKNRPIYQDNEFIFAREDEHPQLRKVVEIRLKRLLKKAEIEKNITPHFIID